MEYWIFVVSQSIWISGEAPSSNHLQKFQCLIYLLLKFENKTKNNKNLGLPTSNNNRPVQPCKFSQVWFFVYGAYKEANHHKIYLFLMKANQNGNAITKERVATKEVKLFNPPSHGQWFLIAYTTTPWLVVWWEKWQHNPHMKRNKWWSAARRVDDVVLCTLCYAAIHPSSKRRRTW